MSCCHVVIHLVCVFSQTAESCPPAPSLHGDAPCLCSQAPLPYLSFMPSLPPSAPQSLASLRLPATSRYQFLLVFLQPLGCDFSGVCCLYLAHEGGFLRTLSSVPISSPSLCSLWVTFSTFQGSSPAHTSLFELWTSLLPGYFTCSLDSTHFN